MPPNHAIKPAVQQRRGCAALYQLPHKRAMAIRCQHALTTATTPERALACIDDLPSTATWCGIEASCARDASAWKTFQSNTRTTLRTGGDCMMWVYMASRSASVRSAYSSQGICVL